MAIYRAAFVTVAVLLMNACSDASTRTCDTLASAYDDMPDVMLGPSEEFVSGSRELGRRFESVAANVDGHEDDVRLLAEFFRTVEPEGDPFAHVDGDAFDEAVTSVEKWMRSECDYVPLYEDQETTTTSTTLFDVGE